jgi:TM2 domain-containing membrane protein YozV
MKNQIFFLGCLLILLCTNASATPIEIGDTSSTEIIILAPDSVQAKNYISETDSIPQKKNSAKENKKKKIVSAIFAFPFPFGFMGAHRVMLGTSPWVPVVYVATFGGCFGLLPLIDFFVITFTKDIEQYENNPHIFMWVK